MQKYFKRTGLASGRFLVFTKSTGIKTIGAKIIESTNDFGSNYFDLKHCPKTVSGRVPPTADPVIPPMNISTPEPNRLSGFNSVTPQPHDHSPPADLYPSRTPFRHRMKTPHSKPANFYNKTAKDLFETYSRDQN